MTTQDLQLLAYYLETNQNFIPGANDHFFQAVLDHSEVISALLYLNRDFEVVNLALPKQLVSKKQDFLSLDYSGHELFNAGVPLEQATWSNTYPSLLTGEASVSLAVPGGRGILLADISLAKLNIFGRLTEQTPVSMVVAIVDRNGVVIKHSQPELARQRYSLLEFPTVARAFKEGLSTPARFNDQTGNLECLQLIPETGWAVQVSLPKAVALAQIQRINWLLWGASSAAIGLGLLLSLWLSLRFLQPMTRLMNFTQQIAAGNYNLQIPSFHYLELNQFAAQFRQMLATITQREEHLSEAKSLMTDLINSVNGVVWEMEPAAQTYNFISQQAEKMFGYSSDRWTQEMGFWQQCIHCEDRQIALHRRFQDVAPGSSLEHEYRVVTAKGRSVWVKELVSVVVRKDQSRVLRGILIDITSQHHAAQVLRDEKEKFRLLSQQFQILLDTIPYHIDLRERSLTVLWSNRPSLTDKERRTLPQCGFHCNVDDYGTYPTCIDCPTSKCYHSGKPEEEIINGRHNTLWHVRAFPVLGAGGEVKQVIQMIDDVTEKQKREQYELRTGQLAALGELAAGVAHEINNPINGIINYAQLIRNRVQPEDRLTDLAMRIIKEGDRVATIVRDLLHFARESSSERHVVHIRHILDEVLSLVGVQLRKEGILLNVDLPEDMPLIESRSHQIEQVFLNLISNARHALSEKFPGANSEKILTISARTVFVKQEKRIKIKFHDKGGGIPANLLEQVMRPFVTTKPAGLGTGLGLSLSHQIIQQHGGTIQIDSQKGEYTCVTVDLPAKS